MLNCDELVEETCVEFIGVTDFVAGLDEYRLEEKVGGGVVLGVEEDIEFSLEYFSFVSAGFPFCLVHSGDIGIVSEEVGACFAEGDDVDFELREGFAEVPDERGKQDGVAEFFLGEDGYGFQFSCKRGAAAPFRGEVLQGACEELAELALLFSFFCLACIGG